MKIRAVSGKLVGWFFPLCCLYAAFMLQGVEMYLSPLALNLTSQILEGNIWNISYAVISVSDLVLCIYYSVKSAD